MVNQDTLTLSAFGVFVLGANLTRLEITLGMTTDSIVVAAALQPFRDYVHIYRLEDIGQEAVTWHDTMASYQGPVEASDMNNLRAARSRWQAVSAERLGELYLITPATVFDAKRLIAGIEGFISKDGMQLLESIEVQDLNEALREVTSIGV